MDHLDHAVFCDLDPEPMPPVALDHTWGAVTGLVANIDELAALLKGFPAPCWDQEGLLYGCEVRAIELANYGVHEAVHHLLDLERTVDDYFAGAEGPGGHMRT